LDSVFGGVFRGPRFGGAVGGHRGAGGVAVRVCRMGMAGLLTVGGTCGIME
jgi:hypothetical protein